MGDFRHLDAWRDSIELARVIYRISATLPASERYELSRQLRRAASSISSNIAEGCGRGSNPAFLAFVRIARGSLHEMESQLYLAVALGYLTSPDVTDAINRAHRLGRRLSRILAASPRVSSQ